MALSIIKHPAPLILANQAVVFSVQSDSIVLPLRISGGVTQSDGDYVQADLAKTATFNLSDYLQGLITERGKTDNIPSVYAAVPQHLSFTFVEWSGDPPQDTFDQETEEYFLIDAYVPKSKRLSVYTAYDTLLAYLTASKSCLSWFPEEAKKVLPLQKDFINFLQLHSPTPITATLSITLYFTDGTNAPAAGSSSISNMEYMQLGYFPTGFTQLGIALLMAQAYPDKILSSYAVVVLHGSTAISKVYTYQVDENWYQYPRILYITNAYGLHEVVLCTGSSQQDNNFTFETAITNGETLPDKITWKTDQINVVKANTGFLTAEQLIWFSDLLASHEAFEMINSVLHPIVITEASVPVMHDDINQYVAEFTYEYTYTQITEEG